MEALLWDICVRYGFCSGDAETLIAEPPPDVRSVVDAILVAEGIDPMLCEKEMRDYLSEAVHDWLFDEGHGKGTKSGLP